MQDRKPGTGIDEREAGRGSEPVPLRGLTVARLRGGLASQLGELRSRLYANDSLEAEFEEWAIMNLEQPVRDVDAEIRIGRRSGLRMYLSPRLLVRSNLKRNRWFADSSLEEGVSCELVSGKHRFLNVKKKKGSAQKPRTISMLLRFNDY